LTVLFGVMVAASALLAVALANRIALVRDLEAGHFADVLTRAQDADDFVSASSAIFLLTQLAIVVLFIVWMFRAAKNNDALGRTSPRFSAGWSIGGWFIPLANFVIPVLIMQDLWRGSDRETRRGVSGWRAGAGSALVAFWWAAWLVSLVRFSYSGSGLQDSGSLDDIETSNTVALVGVIAAAIAAILALLVVRAITRRQLECLRAQRSEYEAGVPAA
jgi:beta-lactamase regulating signal transducer with metallopeptidase domain